MLALLTVHLLGCTAHVDGHGPIPKEDRPKLSDDTAADADADTDSDTDADTDSDTDTDTDTDSDTDADSDPDRAEACHPDVAGWPANWAAYEDRVVELVNEERAAGADCRTGGTFGPAGPLEMQLEIRCAARYHSLWMADTDSFTHESPGGDLGEDPWARMANAGFTGFPIGENIAAGYPDPASVVAGWMASDGHCANIMNPSATLTGVGYYQGGSYGAWWTQDFGS